MLSVVFQLFYVTGLLSITYGLERTSIYITDNLASGPRNKRCTNDKQTRQGRQQSTWTRVMRFVFMKADNVD